MVDEKVGIALKKMFRAVLLSRYKKGTKKQPGPLYGVKGHEMSALAAAIYWWEGVSL